jgi:hypothetical protein
MRVARLILSVSISFLLSISLAAQQAATSSTQALLFLQRSAAALDGGQTLTDVTLSGAARRIAGSDDESGTAVLKALLIGPARVDLSFASGPRGEVVSTGDKCLVGSWIGPDGVSHPISNHNLMSDPSWFFPAFTVARLASPAKYVVSWIGTETWNGRSVEHLSAHQPFDMQLPPSLPSLSHLTQMDLFLDSSSSLPARLDFNVHPDDNMRLDIPVEIVFSDYRIVNGTQVPFHVQKFLNNSLDLDLQFDSATLDSGLSSSDFVVAGLRTGSSPPRASTAASLKSSSGVTR